MSVIHIQEPMSSCYAPILSCTSVCKNSSCTPCLNMSAGAKALGYPHACCHIPVLLKVDRLCVYGWGSVFVGWVSAHMHNLTLLALSVTGSRVFVYSHFCDSRVFPYVPVCMCTNCLIQPWALSPLPRAWPQGGCPGFNRSWMKEAAEEFSVPLTAAPSGQELGRGDSLPDPFYFNNL